MVQYPSVEYLELFLPIADKRECVDLSAGRFLFAAVTMGKSRSIDRPTEATEYIITVQNNTIYRYLSREPSSMGSPGIRSIFSYMPNVTTSTCSICNKHYAQRTLVVVCRPHCSGSRSPVSDRGPVYKHREAGIIFHICVAEITAWCVFCASALSCWSYDQE